MKRPSPVGVRYPALNRAATVPRALPLSCGSLFVLAQSTLDPVLSDG
ncbi:MAG: hypothetical protein HG423_006895 [Propionibacterium sp.]|nr:hypothetical protein [Propionibacterium sp.]